MQALIEKDLKRLLKGKKTYLTLIIIPILLVFFVGQTLSLENPENLPVGVVGNNDELTELIDSIGIFDVQRVEREEGTRKLLNEKICAIIVLPDSPGTVTIILDRAQLITSSLADLVVDSINYDLAYLDKPYHVDRAYRGQDVTMFEYIMAGLLVVVSIFIGVLGGSTELANERKVLFRILFFKSSFSVYLEKILFILFVTLLECLVMLLIGVEFYNFEIHNLLFLLLGIILITVGSTAFGILISLFLKERSAYFGILTSIAMIFFSGVIYPVVLMPPLLRQFASLTPSYYASKVVRMCTIREVPSDILHENMTYLALFTSALFAFSAVFFMWRAKSFSE